MRTLSVLALLVVSIVATSIGGASAHILGTDFHPEILTDDSFDQAVFPSNVAVTSHRPFLIMFYAPWCGHCKHVLPIFNNASRLLYTTPNFKWSTDSARFAVVDATANPRLAQQFRVKSYPTFFYTINGRGYRYGGALTIQDLATNAVFLFQGLTLGTFADDITNFTGYRNVAYAEVPRRPLFVVCRPTRSPPRADGIPHDFTTMVDSVLMQGRPRFAQMIEDEVAFNPKERPKMFKDIHHKQHWLISEGCYEARKALAAAPTAAGDEPLRQVGPENELLLLWSDKTPKPIAYTGPWSGSSNEEALTPFISIKGSSTFRTSRRLALWVWENSYNGIEKATTEIIAGLTKRGKLGILVTEGETNFRTDKKYLPAMQALAQRRTAAFRKANPHFDSGIAAKALTADGGRIGDDFESPGTLHKIRDHAQVQLTIADGALFGDWVRSLGYDMPATSLGGDAVSAYPKFFVFDSLKDTIWRIEEWLPKNGYPSDLLTAVNKNNNQAVDGTTSPAAFALDGPEVTAIAKFLAGIEAPEGSAGALRGAPTTTMGLITRYITDYVPFSSKLSAALGDDPILFLTVIGCCIMFVIVIIVSLRRGSEEDEEAELKALRAAKLARAQRAATQSSSISARPTASAAANVSLSSKDNSISKVPTAIDESRKEKKE